MIDFVKTVLGVSVRRCWALRLTDETSEAWYAISGIPDNPGFDESPESTGGDYVLGGRRVHIARAPKPEALPPLPVLDKPGVLPPIAVSGGGLGIPLLLLFSLLIGTSFGSAAGSISWAHRYRTAPIVPSAAAAAPGSRSCDRSAPPCYL